MRVLLQRALTARLRRLARAALALDDRRTHSDPCRLAMPAEVRAIAAFGHVRGNMRDDLGLRPTWMEEPKVARRALQLGSRMPTQRRA
jgi:hypothetical protein